MQYALQTLWFERKRYLAGIFAVAFSVVLIAVQGGVLVGLVSTVSAPVDLSPAQVWITAPHTQACDNGSPLSRRWLNRLVMMPEVVAADEYVQKFDYWFHPDVGTTLVIICGLNLSDDSLGPISKLTPEQRIALAEPGAIVIDEKDMKKLGIKKIGDIAELRGQKMRVVGTMQDMGSMTGSYVFCSIPTARRLLWYRDDDSTYFMAKLRSEADVPTVLRRLENFTEIEALSKGAFSAKSQWYWILQTKAGLAVFLVALLGLIVGAVVTSQTLYSATVSLLRELAVLRALGVPRWRMNSFVLQQASFIGIVGLILGLPLAFFISTFGNVVGTRIDIAEWLVWATILVTIVIAGLSGLVALRSLGSVDPAELLR